MEEVAAAVLDAAEDDAGDAEEEEEEEDSASDTTAIARLGGVGVAVLIEDPLEEHDATGDDEEDGPPVTVPVPEAMTLHASGLDEEEDDADGDDQDGADDGAAAQAAGLVAVGVALGTIDVALDAGLLLHAALLVLPVVAVGRAVGGSRAGGGGGGGG